MGSTGFKMGLKKGELIKDGFFLFFISREIWCYLPYTKYTIINSYLDLTNEKLEKVGTSM